ncbi:MAG: Uma2 family endonuclease [Acidobacteriota bacterium]
MLRVILPKGDFTITAVPKQKYTMEEYLELDACSDERLEYWDGEIFSMSGVNDQHDKIESNLHIPLSLRSAGRGCRVFLANIRIKVPAMPPYRYGDASALCGSPKFEKIGGVDVLTNPSLIIEVLSTSTEAYDRGDKFTNYKSILTLAEYLLIAQHRPHVSQFIKQPNGSWLNLEFNALDDVLKVVTLECELKLSEIYQEVTFPAAKPNIL